MAKIVLASCKVCSLARYRILRCLTDLVRLHGPQRQEVGGTLPWVLVSLPEAPVDRVNQVWLAARPAANF